MRSIGRLSSVDMHALHNAVGERRTRRTKLRNALDRRGTARVFVAAPPPQRRSIERPCNLSFDWAAPSSFPFLAVPPTRRCSSQCQPFHFELRTACLRLRPPLKEEETGAIGQIWNRVDRKRGGCGLRRLSSEAEVRVRNPEATTQRIPYSPRPFL